MRMKILSEIKKKDNKPLFLGLLILSKSHIISLFKDMMEDYVYKINEQSDKILDLEEKILCMTQNYEDLSAAFDSEGKL